MTKPGLQHEKPRTGRKKIKEMEPCHDIKKKRQEITGNATRKPLRPLMTSCKSRPAMVYEAKKRKVDMPMEMEMGVYVPRGIRSETSRLGDVRDNVRTRRDVKR
jgi:hypothetical protein